MATTFNSNTYANQISVLRDGEPGETRTRFFEGATGSADTGVINLVKLPPGKLRILTKLSGFLCANMGANANVSLGLNAYTAANGAAVAAANAVLGASAAANTYTLANFTTSMNNVANAGLLVDSMSGVVVRATVADGNTVANNTYSGYITFAYLG